MTGHSPAELDREAIRDEMERTRQTFHHLLDHATAAELRRQSHGTRWTNEQLLFHMLFGYLIVRQLLVLARIFGRTQGRASTVFARLLDAARTPLSPDQLRRILHRREDHPPLPHRRHARPRHRGIAAPPGPRI